MASLVAAGTLVASLLIAWVVLANWSTGRGTGNSEPAATNATNTIATHSNATSASKQSIAASTDSEIELASPPTEIGTTRRSNRLDTGRPGQNGDTLTSIQMAWEIPTVDSLSLTMEEFFSNGDSVGEVKSFATPVTRGIRPVANSMASALSVIRRTLPGHRAAAEKPQASLGLASQVVV
jgi:hypothetical protein